MPTRPQTRKPDALASAWLKGWLAAQSTATDWAIKSAPNTSAKRWFSIAMGSWACTSHLRHCSTNLPSCQMAKPTSGRAKAWRRTASMQCDSSVASDFKNLRRAGVLKNNSFTSTVVPVLRPTGRNSPVRPSSIKASLRPLARDKMAQSAIELMAASASPRKPMVATDSKSCRLPILLVAWRLNAIGNSSRTMPWPSSSTAISRTPPASSRTVTWLAPASRALSTSSRTTEAGRSTTSPAAIWLISSSGSSRIGRRGRGGNEWGKFTALFYVAMGWRAEGAVFDCRIIEGYLTLISF